MNKLKTSIAALTLGACATPVIGLAADDISYSYVSASYVNLDIDQPNEDSIFREDFDNGGGYALSFSLPLSEALFVYGDYSDTEADFTFVDNTDAIVPGNTDLLKFNLGLGVVFEASEYSDFVISGGYSDIDYDDFQFGATDDPAVNDLDDDPSDGWTADAYLRSQLSPGIETAVGARYTDIEGIDGVSLVGKVIFEMTQNLGLELGVDAGDEIAVWNAGVRASF